MGLGGFEGEGGGGRQTQSRERGRQTDRQRQSWCLLAAYRPSNMLVCLRDGAAQTSLRPPTPRYKLQTKPAVSPSRSRLTPGQPVSELKMYRQVPRRAATGVPVLKSLV